MEKLDRLVWAAGISFRAYGVRVGVRVNRSEALDQVREYLPPQWKLASSPVVERLYSLVVGGEGPRAGVRRFHLLYGNSARLSRSRELENVLQPFESDLQLYVAERAPRRVFVHAGVVGWQGRAILIPGRSFSGKSTLVSELVRAGATYYSDEYAVLDERGRVHSYPRRLGLRSNGSASSERYSAESLGWMTGNRPLPIGLVVVTTYRSRARWRPRVLSPGKGALELLDNTVSIQQRPEVALPVLRQVASEAAILKSARGEAKDAVELILGTMQEL